MNVRMMEDVGDEVAAVAECDRLRLGGTSYAWSEDRIRGFAGCGRRGGSVRLYVAEERGKVCGAVLYSREPGSYEVRLLTARPDAPEGTRDKLLEHVRRFTKVANGRKSVEAVVTDGDDDSVKFFLDRGFKLKRNGVDEFGVIDSWRLTWSTK